ncbi:putative signal recognition particle, SRP54 subunit, helical bundle, SRP/SRP receptor [Helianthus annuus]|nr:putative signal recognition particle, SRP54 subunit, helical bundle, SRP/SRP receptor [Helianthus annuus]
MVLVELGGSISGALEQMSNATIIDEKILNIGLNDMNRALLQFDVQFTLVGDMQTNIKKIVDLDSVATGYNKKKIIQQVYIVSFLQSALLKSKISISFGS